MTALCGGGPSHAKAGYQDPIYFTTSAIAAFFNALPTPWLLDFVSYLGPQNIDPSSFCAVDPPADPGMTALDFAQVFQISNPFIQTPALFKLAQLFRRYLWFQICECVSGPQPASPAAPVPPAGLIDINPPALTPPIPSAPCYVNTAYNGGVGPGGSVAGNTLVMPAGATTLILRITAIGAEGGTIRTGNVTLSTNWSTPSGSGILNVQETFTITPSQDAPLEFTVHIPANAGSLRYQVAATGSGWMGFLHADHVVYCNGVSPTGTPCDQSQDLSAILALLEYLRSQIDLIQRQSVPFAYVQGAVHSGLTGSGEIAVSGLIGCRVLVTSNAFGSGAEAGDPDALFGEGHINWGNADGFKRLERIGSSPMVSLPPSAGQYTRIGYSLPPGAEVEITELVRES